MTFAFAIGLLALCFGVPYLWRSHRMEFWGWLALYAGQRLGKLVKRERERRQAALAGEHLVDEIGRAWLDRPIAKVRMR